MQILLHLGSHMACTGRCALSRHAALCRAGASARTSLSCNLHLPMCIWSAWLAFDIHPMCTPYVSSAQGIMKQQLDGRSCAAWLAFSLRPKCTSHSLPAPHFPMHCAGHDEAAAGRPAAAAGAGRARQLFLLRLHPGEDALCAVAQVPRHAAGGCAGLAGWWVSDVAAACMTKGRTQRPAADAAASGSLQRLAAL